MPAPPKEGYKCRTCGRTDAETKFYPGRYSRCARCRDARQQENRRCEPGVVYTCATCGKTSEQTRFYAYCNYYCADCANVRSRRSREKRRVDAPPRPPRLPRCRVCGRTSDVTPFRTLKPGLCIACHEEKRRQEEADRAEYFVLFNGRPPKPGSGPRRAEMINRCRVCGRTSTMTRFYASQRTICATCHNLLVLKHRKENADHYREYNRKRSRLKASVRKGGAEC